MAAARPTFLKGVDVLLKQTSYDAVVIGGGHNGLVAAFYLAKSGKKVCVLERRHTLGGAAVTEEIVPGFKFSRASYVLGLLRPTIFRDMELQRHGLRVYPRNPSSYTPLHEKYWTDFKAKSLTLGLDAKENYEQIAKFSLKDAQAFPKFEVYLNKIVDVFMPLMEVSPPDFRHFGQLSLVSKIRHLKQFLPLFKAAKNLGTDVPGFLKLLTGPSETILNQWFESEPLKATLATDSVIGSMSSPRTPGSGYVLLHHVMAASNGVKGAWGFPEGGMGAVTEAMAKAAAEAGADLFVDQPVKQILVDSENRVRGVKLENGELEIGAQNILSNATPHVTFLDLLPPDSLPEEFVGEIKNIDYSSPVCKINVALRSIPSFAAANSEPNAVMPHHRCTVHLNCEHLNFIDDAYLTAKRGIIPEKPMIEITFPSSCDPTLAPKGSHVALLFTQYVPCRTNAGTESQNFKAMKEMYVQKVFDAVEEYAPGFKSSIVDYEALMPSDLEQIFGLTGGNIFHGSMGLHQLFTARPSAYQSGGPRTPINGLYICGAGAHPGGGVMGAPGLIASKVLLNQ